MEVRAKGLSVSPKVECLLKTPIYPGCPGILSRRGCGDLAAVCPSENRSSLKEFLYSQTHYALQHRPLTRLPLLLACNGTGKAVLSLTSTLRIR